VNCPEVVSVKFEQLEIVTNPEVVFLFLKDVRDLIMRKSIAIVERFKRDTIKSDESAKTAFPDKASTILINVKVGGRS